MSLALLGLALSFALTASAIIRRDDVSDDDYIVEDSDYPEVVDLFEPGDCTGTLIHALYLLTVAHCAEDLRARSTLTVAGALHVVDEVILHPMFTGWPYDIALIRFETPVRGVTPVPLYRKSDELGQTLTIVGRGVHATGLEGEPGGTTDGRLRRATNVVSAVTGQWLEVYFEPPDDPNVTDLEGVGAEGDSGGPAFIENEDGRFLAGLNSWGDSRQDSAIGKYGAWDYSTRVSHFADWVDQQMGIVPPDGDAAATDGSSSGCQIASTDAPWGWWGLAMLGLLLAVSRPRGLK
jgi:MYXO-CTERM domain-containing protein